MERRADHLALGIDAAAARGRDRCGGRTLHCVGPGLRCRSAIRCGGGDDEGVRTRRRRERVAGVDGGGDAVDGGRAASARAGEGRGGHRRGRVVGAVGGSGDGEDGRRVEGGGDLGVGSRREPAGRRRGRAVTHEAPEAVARGGGRGQHDGHTGVKEAGARAPAAAEAGRIRRDGARAGPGEGDGQRRRRGRGGRDRGQRAQCGGGQDQGGKHPHGHASPHAVHRGTPHTRSTSPRRACLRAAPARKGG